MPTEAREFTHPWHPFIWDVNADGQFTITDIGLWLQHAFFLPGDWIIWIVLSYSPELSRFFELGVSDYGSTISALLSVFVWLGVTVAVLMTSHLIMRLDRAITGVLTRARDACLIKLRIAKRLVVTKFRQLREKPSESFDLSEEAQLSAEEFEVLKVHAVAEPPEPLPISAVIRATALPRERVRRILTRLRELDLLARHAEAGDEDSYALTKPGRAFVVFKKLSAG